MYLNVRLIFVGILVTCTSSVYSQSTWQPNGSSGMIYYNDGNVGIGTTNPAPLLSIYKNTNATNYGGYTAMEINNPNISGDAISALVLRSGTIPGSGLSGAVGGISTKAIDNASQYLWLRAYASTYPIYVGYTQSNLVITNGKVGIGTTAPVEKLSVNGTILAQKVRVSQAAADWPDYVFEKDYPLPALDSVEVFINANKHLPNVPGAKEVSENGVDLGENQKILLQKTEELTLYLIQQNKIIESLKSEISDLRREVNELTNKNN